MPEGVLLEGADLAIDTVGLWRKQEVGSTVSGVAMREDAMEGDFVQAEPRAELPEHAPDGGPVVAVTPQENERGSVTEQRQQVPAELYFRGGKRRPGVRDGACIAGRVTGPSWTAAQMVVRLKLRRQRQRRRQGGCPRGGTGACSR